MNTHKVATNLHSITSKTVTNNKMGWKKKNCTQLGQNKLTPCSFHSNNELHNYYYQSKKHAFCICTTKPKTISLKGQEKKKYPKCVHVHICIHTLLT